MSMISRPIAVPILILNLIIIMQIAGRSFEDQEKALCMTLWGILQIIAIWVITV